MAADWSALTHFLRRQGDEITVTWGDLEDIVGGMPRSSIDHGAWWGGDRPHTRAWQLAGFRVLSKRPGVSVTFRRTEPTEQRPAVLPRVQPLAQVRSDSQEVGDPARVLLITCVKVKAATPSAAKDLYTSTLFKKARAHAERRAVPWFIVSAEHGLVQPDEWLAPYERYLPDTPRDYRAAWGEWVVARLELLAGPVRGRTIEAHLGEAYVLPMLPALERRGAVLERPLEGLSSGRWLEWYDARAAAFEPSSSPRVDLFHEDAGKWVARLGDASQSCRPSELPDLERSVMDGPGLYSWFVDADGAEALSHGLDETIEPGLIYVGLTGATKWSSGKSSANTLLGRIRGQHLRGRRSSSTLRRTLGSILDSARSRTVLREELSVWMAEHLRVVPAISENADSLGDLERQVVQALEPPLNLDHVALTPVRSRLKQLRAEAGLRGTE